MAVKVPGQQGDNQVQAQTIERFAGLNTKAARPGIGDEEFAWVMNFMPIGPQNLRTLYDKGATLYSAPNPLQDQIIFTYAYNIGETSYQAVFLDNGTAYQVNRASGAITTISSTAGRFYSPGGDLPHCAQWQSKYLIIVSSSSSVEESGYWIWNGSQRFGAGTLSPDVTLLDSGSSYNSAPTVTAVGGSGTGATFSATVENGVVTQVAVTNPGSGYLINEQVTLRFSGGGSDNGAAATATVTLTSGGVSSIIVTDGGTGYTVETVVTFSGGGGSGAQAVITGAANGVITAITVTHPGSGYTSAPTVTITDNGSTPGSGATAVSRVTTGQVTAITIANGGTGYDAPPLVVITGDGSGAEATCTLSGGTVNTVTVRNPGIGYTYASIAFVGGNDAARASVTLMPFGVKGNSVETFQSRVWVSNDTTVSFTAPASTSDFATSAGGGTYAATESFLRQRITRMIQSSGFLYQIADSSINVISNVQTSGNPPTTTFNNANIDPQVGCPWRDTVQPFGRALVFANSSGVYALYGGAAEKVSAPLDGLFASATFNTGASGGVTPTAGVATVFGIRVYGLLFTTINPYTGEQQTLFACWDGQNWFCHAPSQTPRFAAAEEIDSELTLWANDGTDLYPLFQTPNEELEKVFQTKLRPDPSYVFRKQVNRVYMMAESYGENPPEFEIGIDTELGDGTLGSHLIAGPAIEWVNDAGAFIQFTGAGGTVLYFRSGGLGIYGYQTSNYGLLIGVTAKTFAADCRVLSVTALLVPQYSTYA